MPTGTRPDDFVLGTILYFARGGLLRTLMRDILVFGLSPDRLGEVVHDAHFDSTVVFWQRAVCELGKRFAVYTRVVKEDERTGQSAGFV